MDFISMKRKLQTITIVKIIAIIMLFGALAKNPYSYYQILRWVIFGLTGYSAYLAYKHGENAWTWIFGIIAVLFNPIAPIYLHRKLWTVIDIIVAAIIFRSLFVLKREGLMSGFKSKEEYENLRLEKIDHLQRPFENNKKIEKGKSIKNLGIGTIVIAIILFFWGIFFNYINSGREYGEGYWGDERLIPISVIFGVLGILLLASAIKSEK
jgi:hypothetical protein